MSVLALRADQIHFGGTQGASNSAPESPEKKVVEATTSVWKGLAEGMKKSYVAKPVTITLLTATTIALVFLLVSNPLGWIASAMGVSLLAAKILVGGSIGLTLLAANYAAYKMQNKETRQQIKFELSAIWRMMPGANYNEISLRGLNFKEGKKIPQNAKLYVGALPNQNRPGNSIPPNLGGVVSNNEPFELSPLGLSNPLQEEDWKSRRVEYLYNETTDHAAMSPESMDKAADFIHNQVKAGKVALSHCRGGVGRSATAAAAFIMKYLKTDYGSSLSIEEVCTRIKAGRKDSTIWNKLLALKDYDVYLVQKYGNSQGSRKTHVFNKYAEELAKMERAGKKTKLSKAGIQELSNPYKNNPHLFS